MPAWLTTIVGWLGYLAKAIFAAATVAIASLISALEALPDGAGLGDISTLGWLIVGGAALFAFGGVFGLTNKSSP